MNNKEEMREEALTRMAMLKLHPNVIRKFAEEGKLKISYQGILHDLDEPQAVKIRKFEKENNCLVYHVIQNDTDFEEMLTLLYISSYQEEWEQDRIDLKEGFPLSYVINIGNDTLSEFSSVEVQSHMGGVIRIA